MKTKTKSEELTETKKKFLEINETVSQLDPVMRAMAFERLAKIAFKDDPLLPKEQNENINNSNPDISFSSEERDKFFSQLEHDTPKDNVLQVVAWLYNQYGVFPISKAILDKEASIAGLTIPVRPDNTMRQAKNEGKNLFCKRGNGWNLTIPGEQYLKEKYKIKKGRNSLPSEFSSLIDKGQPSSSKSRKPKNSNKPQEGAKGTENSSGSQEKKKSKAGRAGPATLFNELIAEGFFDEKHTISDIVTHISKDKAHKFKANELSTPLARFVREKKLKREPNSKNIYVYFKP